MPDKDTSQDDTSAAQPTIEGTHPNGGGVGSGSNAGGNKRDPVESSPTVGNTIAGRDATTGAEGGKGLAGVNTGNLRSMSSSNNVDETHRDGPEGGATGVSGKDQGSGHEVPDQNPASTHPEEDSRT